MSTGSAFVLGAGVGAVLVAPLVAPFALWLMERSITRPSKPVDYRRWPQ